MSSPPIINRRTSALAFVLPMLSVLPLVAMGCGPTEFGSNYNEMSFEEFEAATFLEPFEGGVYIVNGDEPIENEKQLYEFWQKLYSPDKLIANGSGSGSNVWSSSQKLNLTYCVSQSSFGSRYNAAVSNMAAATAQWEAAANVNFVHVSSQDGNCTQNNNNVLFDVRNISSASYLARAFFPGQGRSSRNVIVATSAFSSSWPLENILVHELGHVLGFRHEHTRPESGTCFEDNNWTVLTPYDSSSVMHYPQCNGTNPNLTMTNRDRQGAAALYGASGGGGGGGGGGGTPQSGSASGTVTRNQQTNYNPLSVVSGSQFKVVMTGTNDADLYVRFGAQPTTSRYDCRPYRNGSSETCTLDVPSGQSQAYISVRGYSSSASNYTINVNWVAP